jgi:hypothetical protein
LTGAAPGYPPSDMVLILLVLTVLGPFALALALLGVTRRCEVWLEGGRGTGPGPVVADGPLTEATAVVAPAADGAAFAA